MIISASYKTDIPAFYGAWFLNRLKAGYCKMINPYGRQVSTVSLTRPEADGFVFWTRNIGPFREALREVAEGGFPFIVQYTITGYPRALEPSVIDWRRAVEHMHGLSNEFGPHAAVWRYDPIVTSSLTEEAWHIENFTQIAGELEGTTDECVISFTHSYVKTKRNMDAAAREHEFFWRDPGAQWKRDMSGNLAAVASQFGMKLTLCSQPEFVSGEAGESRCIDAARLGRMAGHPIPARQKGNRPGCACFESRDIGDYDSCPHGCVYCYAVRNRSLARGRFAAHDPNSEFLIAPEGAARAVLTGG